MANTYTDQQVAEALAALELNGGNVKRTSRELGIPRTSLLRWRDGVSAVPDTENTEPQQRDFAEMWAEVQRVATARMLALLPAEMDLRVVAVAAGIAADKHLDYSQGRKGDKNGDTNIAVTQINVAVKYDYEEPRH